MLFLEIERCEFSRPFQFGRGTISSHGSFAVGYTFEFDKVIQAHGISKLCDYGNLLTENHPSLGLVPQLWVFEVDSIESPCTAIPYDNDSNIVDDHEWIILKPKQAWYKIFIDLMKDAQQTRSTNDKKKATI